MPKMVHGADGAPVEMSQVTLSTQGYFMYDGQRDEYGVALQHRLAPELARIVLAGAADYDRLPDDVVGRRIGGLLLPQFAEVAAETVMVGVATTSPTRLQASLDAFIRLPEVSISDRELAHLARADFASFWSGLSGPTMTAA